MISELWKKMKDLFSMFFFFSSVAVIVGGIDSMSQSLALAKKPHIVIGE